MIPFCPIYVAGMFDDGIQFARRKIFSQPELGEGACAKIHCLLGNDEFLNDVFTRHDPADPGAGRQYFGEGFQIDDIACIGSLLIQLVD